MCSCKIPLFFQLISLQYSQQQLGSKIKLHIYIIALLEGEGRKFAYLVGCNFQMNQNNASEQKREHNYRYNIKPHLKRSYKIRLQDISQFEHSLKTVELNFKIILQFSHSNFNFFRIFLASSPLKRWLPQILVTTRFFMPPENQWGEWCNAVGLILIFSKESWLFSYRCMG